MTSNDDNNITKGSELVQPRADKHRKRQYEEADSHEAGDSIASLEQTIFNMGNKHPTMSIEEDIEETAKLLCADFEKASGRFSDTIAACVLELPHKITFYAKLLTLLVDAKELVKETLEKVFGYMKAASIHGPWRHFTQSLRLFALLANTGVLAKDVFGTLVMGLLNDVSKDSIDFVLWSIGAALPLAGPSVDPVLRQALEQTFEKRLESNAIIPVPSDVTSVLLCGKMGGGMSTEGIISATTNVEPISSDIFLEPNALIRIEFVDPHWDGDYKPFALFEDTYTCDDWNRWTISYNCRLLVESMELNHRRCADLLLNGIDAELGVVEKIVVEFLFGELIRPRRNLIACLVYEVLLMDCCRLSRTFPPAMAKALHTMFDRLELLGIVATEKLANWFAGHLSNFDFKWNWMAWERVLSAPSTSIQLIFVKFTLSKLMRLSYHDRVIPTLPEEFKRLLPVEPIPNYTFSSENVNNQVVEKEDAELANRLVEAIQQRRPVAEIKEGILGSSTKVSQEIVIQSMLLVGSKSLSHMLAVIENYLLLLQFLLPSSGGDNEAKIRVNIEMLDQIYSFWKTSPLHFEFIVERLVNYRIILPKALIKWSLDRSDGALSGIEREEGDGFENVIQFYQSKNLIFRTLQQSFTMPTQARQKLKDAPEEKIKNTMDSLKREFEETLTLLIEGLAMLPNQFTDLANDTQEVASAIRMLTIDYLREIIIFTFRKEVGSIANSILHSCGKNVPVEVKSMLEQVAAMQS